MVIVGDERPQPFDGLISWEGQGVVLYGGLDKGLVTLNVSGNLGAMYIQTNINDQTAKVDTGRCEVVE